MPRNSREEDLRAKAAELALAYHEYRLRLIIDFVKPTTITEVGFGDLLRTAEGFLDYIENGMPDKDKGDGKVEV